MLRPKAAIKGEPPEFSLAVGGPLYDAYLRTHLADKPIALVHRRVLAYLLITWVPLCLLSPFDARGADVTVSFLRDIDVHTRLLIALPLFVVAEPFVHGRLTGAVRQFIDRGLIAPADLRRFGTAVVSSVKLRNSPLLEIAILLVAFIGGQWAWESRVSLKVGTWYNNYAADGSTLTLAGRWYAFVSLPLFRFLALRWLVRLIVVWYRFLWLVSRIPLRLNALHPDRTGGLGFLNTSVFAFAPILLANASLLSGMVAQRIWYEGATLPQFKMEILGVVVVLMLLVLLPQTFFAIQLERTWRTSSGEYGILGSRYVDEFRRKWLTLRPHTRESLVGSADIQSLADLANAYEVIRDMYLVPITRTTVLRLGVLTIIPLLPLLLTMVPFEQIVDHALDMFI
jgi:hypothetical protein